VLLHARQDQGVVSGLFSGSRLFEGWIDIGSLKFAFATSYLAAAASHRPDGFVSTSSLDRFRLDPRAS
jgi:hypothetical protein